MDYHIVYLHWEDKTKEKKFLAGYPSLQEALEFCCRYIFFILKEDQEFLEKNKFKLEVLKDLIVAHENKDHSQVVNLFNTEFRRYSDDPYIVILESKTEKKQYPVEGADKIISAFKIVLEKEKK